MRTFSTKSLSDKVNPYLNAIEFFLAVTGAITLYYKFGELIAVFAK